MIAVPSYKRALNCKTAKLLKKAVIFCHEFEAEEYKKHNKNEIITIPDDLKGKGMARIRNYILDNSPEEVVMMDDDINHIGYYEGNEMIKMEEKEVYELIDKGFQMCRDLKTTLWGLNLQSDKKFYREYSPFSFSSVVLGPFFAIIKDPHIRFDEKLGLKEDYDYALQVLNKYRKILRMNKYHYSCDHITAKGGCASYRTIKKEEEQAITFQKKWGDRVVTIKRKTQNGNLSINPIVQIPIKGI